MRSLHPTLKFLMWDYGSLDEHQERDYINAKMKMINRTMPNPEVSGRQTMCVAPTMTPNQLLCFTVDPKTCDFYLRSDQHLCQPTIRTCALSSHLTLACMYL